MTRTARVVMVLALAIAVSSATKAITHIWHVNVEESYAVSLKKLKAYDSSSAPSPWFHPVECLSRRWQHYSENMPDYTEALFMSHLSALVDDVLVWIVISIFLLTVMFWAAAKMFNGWVDGAFVRCKSLEAEQLENGDIVIHFRHEKHGEVK